MLNTNSSLFLVGWLAGWLIGWLAGGLANLLQPTQEGMARYAGQLLAPAEGFGRGFFFAGQEMLLRYFCVHLSP